METLMAVNTKPDITGKKTVCQEIYIISKGYSILFSKKRNEIRILGL